MQGHSPVRVLLPHVVVAHRIVQMEYGADDHLNQLVAVEVLHDLVVLSLSTQLKDHFARKGVASPHFQQQRFLLKD